MIVDQLLRAGTSVGANLEEAKSASSKREFIRYAEISLRGAREAHYWIRISLGIKLGDERELRSLLGECDQIVRILVTIVRHAKQRV